MPPIITYRPVRGLVVLACVSALAAPGGSLRARAPASSGPADAGSHYWGAPVDIGQGVARSVVRTDASGEPVVVGVEFTPGVLEALPERRARDRSLG